MLCVVEVIRSTGKPESSFENEQIVRIVFDDKD